MNPYGAAMRARFDGTCKACNEIIKAGKHEITKDENGNWIHLCKFPALYAIHYLSSLSYH